MHKLDVQHTAVAISSQLSGSQKCYHTAFGLVREERTSGVAEMLPHKSIKTSTAANPNSEHGGEATRHRARRRRSRGAGRGTPAKEEGGRRKEEGGRKEEGRRVGEGGSARGSGSHGP